VGVVDVDFHQFTISSGYGPDEPVLDGSACLLRFPTATRVAVMSGVATGPVTVHTQALSQAPTAVADGWQDVAEVSLVVGEDPLVVGGWNLALGEDERLDVAGPGTYRVRVHANGRDTDYDAAVFEPVEQYVVQAWPAPYAPLATLRASSDVAALELARHARDEPRCRPRAASAAAADEGDGTGWSASVAEGSSGSCGRRPPCGC